MGETISKHKSPEVSVCIASYNHNEFIGATIESILTQSFENFEIVVVDDGSSDDSLRILQEYSLRDPRVRVFHHANNENRGISKTTNRAIHESAGKFISFIGSDDLWYPETMELQLAKFRSEPTLGMVYGLTDVISKDGELTGDKLGTDITLRESQVEAAIEWYAIPALTVMIKRECLDKVGHFDEELTYGDWDLSVRILSKYKAGFIDRPIAQYRVHDRNTSIGQGASHDKIRLNSRAVLDKVKRNANDFALPKSRLLRAVELGLSNVDKRVANLYIDDYFASVNGGDRRLRFASLVKAWKLSPTSVLRPRRLAALIKSLLLRPARRFGIAS